MASGERALRPVRRPRLPGGGTLLRAGLVAALLGLAVMILDAPPDCPDPSPAGGPAAGRQTGAAPTVGSAAPGARPADRSGPARATGAPPADEVPGPTDGVGTGTDEPADGVAVPGRPTPLPLPSGSVGLPVRLAEPAASAVLRPGARVDLLVVPAGRPTGEATLLAGDARVLDVLGGDAADGTSALYLALRPEQARRAVGQPEGSRFAVVVRG